MSPQHYRSSLRQALTSSGGGGGEGGFAPAALGVVWVSLVTLLESIYCNNVISTLTERKLRLHHMSLL